MSNVKPIILSSGTSSTAISISTAQWINEKNRKSRECDNEFVKVENLKASKGNLIEFRRVISGNFSIHEHWGVYIGDGEIIDLVNLGDGNGMIRRENLSDVAEDSMCRVNNLVNEGKRRNLEPRNEIDILKAAYYSLGKEVKYDVLRHNCEQFATYCLYGTPFSVQSDVAKKNLATNIAAEFINWYSSGIVDSITAGEFVEAGRSRLNVGVLIEIQRDKENHWGIYAGEGCIFHLVDLGNKKGVVYKDLLEEVSKNCLYRVNNLETEAGQRGLIPKNERQIMMTAYGMLNEKIEYDYLNYNCEHFATHCLYGTAFSVKSEIAQKNPSKNFKDRICCSIVLQKK